MPDTSAHPLRDGLAKFWAPVPWLFEAAIVFQVVRHKYCEAGVIAGLLVFNAALAYFQEGRAQATLAALKSRLARSGLRRTCICWMGRPAGSVDAYWRILAGGSRRRRRHLCRCTGTAGRSDGQGDRHVRPYQVWPHGGADSNCPCGQYPTEGCASDRAQPGDLQHRFHPSDWGLCPPARDAVERGHPALTYLGARGGPGGVACDCGGKSCTSKGL
jgi:hypothetical protein